MAYQIKMLFRLAAPAGVVLVFGLILAGSVSAFAEVPMLAGGRFAQMGDAVALATACLALLVYVVQMHRYWRWTQDEGDVCFVCSCLLGRERDGRYGPYRKCLGCGKNHAIGHR